MNLGHLFFNGLEIRQVPNFGRPCLERETFSGGRNLSAIERNRQRWAEFKGTQRVVITRDVVFVPSCHWRNVTAQLERLRQAVGAR